LSAVLDPQRVVVVLYKQIEIVCTLLY